ncbi:hypothetical protein N8482_00510 [Chitinophagales bacterium]|nr:hypothetical protein [Chitinophagales bacterium]
MKRYFIFLSALLLGLGVHAQSEFADVLVASSFEATLEPEADQFDDFYGGEGNECSLSLVDPQIVLGDNNFFLSLPTGSEITVQFVDNCIVDAPGQADLFLDEVGAASEMAAVFVSSDGVNYIDLGIIDGGVVNEVDLAGSGLTAPVKFLRLVGLDDEGCSPGFDIVSIYGLPGANCEAFAGLSTNADISCQSAGSLDLQSYVVGSDGGTWSGEGQNEGIVDPSSLSVGEYVFTYTVEDPLVLCPGDAQSIIFTIDDCIVPGCMDAAACNFNPDANEDDGSCAAPDCLGECGGLAIVGSSCNDGLDTTIEDAYNADCNCEGTPVFSCMGEMDQLELDRIGALCATGTEFPIDGDEVYTWYNGSGDVVAVMTASPCFSPSEVGSYTVVVTDPDYPACSQALGPRIIDTLDGCCELPGSNE